MSTESLISARFKTDPYDHQWREFEVSADLQARALLWDMRTGKTKLTIDTACSQHVEQAVDAVVVLAPNGVHRNWLERELPAHAWEGIDHRALAWDTEVAGEKGIQRVEAARRRQWEEDHAAFWARAEELLKHGDGVSWFSFANETVTRDDVRRLIARIKRRKKRIMLVVDEVDDYGKAGSKKTKMVRALAKRCHSRRILSGTVVENSPLRAYSQYEMLAEGALGFGTYEEFEGRYAEYERKQTRGGRSYPKLKGYVNLEELRERMASWSSVVLRGDCQDMPSVVRTPRRVVMTEQQQRVYRELHDATRLHLDSGQELSIGEMTNRLVKLQQVSSGYVVDEFGERHVLSGDNPRLDACLDEVDLMGGRCIVWCAFRPEMDMVAEALRRRYPAVYEYHGRTSEEDKALVRRAFAPGSELPLGPLVAHQRAAGRGLNLSRATGMIYFSHWPDAVFWSQSLERATERGGENVPVRELVASPTDEYILYDILEGKREVAEQLARTGLQEVLARVSLDRRP